MYLLYMYTSNPYTLLKFHYTLLVRHNASFKSDFKIYRSMEKLT